MVMLADHRWRWPSNESLFISLSFHVPHISFLSRFITFSAMLHCNVTLNFIFLSIHTYNYTYTHTHISDNMQSCRAHFMIIWNGFTVHRHGKRLSPGWLEENASEHQFSTSCRLLFSSDVPSSSWSWLPRSRIYMNLLLGACVVLI